MAKQGSILDAIPGETVANVGLNDAFGTTPVVDENDLEAPNRVVQTVDQAVAMTQTDIDDARILIKNAKKITAKKNGSPPYNPKALEKQGKSHKRNISTRFLQKELNRCAPRLFMPILGASTMTAASLPAGWPKGQEKTKFFQDTMTQAIRGWRKNDMYWRGLAQEVCDFGFAFAAWTDPLEWRPHLCRMDRGFVPRGTEIMEEKLPRFTLKWDYKPNDLLELAKNGSEDNWNRDAVAAAVDKANLPAMAQDNSKLRKWEELIREQSPSTSYTKGSKVIECRHLFVLENSGEVSHYILWPDGPEDCKLLYENLDGYESSDSCVIPLTFGYGDGTIHGSWGAGQLLYDLAVQVEKIRCDAIDNLLNSNKAKVEVPNAKDVAAAQLTINDTMIIVAGGRFANAANNIQGSPDGYMALDNRMTQWAQEIVGSYLPPLPNQASKAATDGMNEAINNEQQIQKDVQENWLKQVALVVAQMIKRMLNKDSDDEYAKAVRSKLLGDNVGWFTKLLGKAREKIDILKKIIPPAPVSLTEEELEILINQPVVQSVSDFTPFAASARGAFAASVMNNPLFKQDAVARFMADGVQGAGPAFADSICVPTEDTSSQVAQQRQQQIESVTMLITQKAVGVVPLDNHWIHWGVLDPQLEQVIQNGQIPAATAGLQHLAAHFSAGVATRVWPPDQINASKARLAQLQKALEAKQQEQAAAQAQQQAQQGQPGMAPVVPMPQQAPQPQPIAQ